VGDSVGTGLCVEGLCVRVNFVSAGCSFRQ
jgi:hypothetical protein